jgi:hypothetical protein
MCMYNVSLFGSSHACPACRQSLPRCGRRSVCFEVCKRYLSCFSRLAFIKSLFQSLTSVSNSQVRRSVVFVPCASIAFQHVQKSRRSLLQARESLAEISRTLALGLPRDTDQVEAFTLLTTLTLSQAKVKPIEPFVNASLMSAIPPRDLPALSRSDVCNQPY